MFKKKSNKYIRSTNRKKNKISKKTRRSGGGKYVKKHKSRRYLLNGGEAYISGSDLRNKLVMLCRKNKWEDYHNLTNDIIKNKNLTKEFLYHLQNEINLQTYKSSFRDNTLLCLEPCLTRFQEEAIPESMDYLTYIIYN
jgi:hypothetical protein